MSNHDTSIPLLKGNINIVAQEDTDAGSTQQYRLMLGYGYFLISVKTRGLILALLRSPETQQHPESDFAGNTSERIPAMTLSALAKQILSPLLSCDAPLPLSRSPYIVYATLISPPYAARWQPRLRVIMIVSSIHEVRALPSLHHSI